IRRVERARRRCASRRSRLRFRRFYASPVPRRLRGRRPRHQRQARRDRPAQASRRRIPAGGYRAPAVRERELRRRAVERRGPPFCRFVAFDPNRMNPFMWLYRDPVSPFYSSLGVTPNERPVLAGEVAAVFQRAGFAVTTHYIAGLAYRYVASWRTRLLLPIYNLVDAQLFGLSIMERFRPFVLTAGSKPAAAS